MKVTNRLRVLRAEVRWSQMELSRRARVSTNRIWRFENGYAEPTDRELARLARALRVSVEEIVPVPREVAS
jgi:transcriptional regulator with XRE-family HTH domain